MLVHRLLQEHERSGRKIGVGLIGAGKFGTMFLSQMQSMVGVRLVGVADLDPHKAQQSLAEVGWKDRDVARGKSPVHEGANGCYVTDDAEELIRDQRVDVVLEATGNARAGVDHALACFDAGTHIVMGNVEADALVGPVLTKMANQAGTVYSMAYGDQPALVHELVEWARAVGLEVVCAGKGTKYLPEYHHSTPETVWEYYGIQRDRALAAGMNPKMFNSYIDGTKHAVEMAAVANACLLQAPSNGLAFPPASVHELAGTLRPQSAGGALEEGQSVEVVSSLRRDGDAIGEHLRWGMYVTFRAPNEYSARCLGEYGVDSDVEEGYGSLYRPYHMNGLETGISVASAALRQEATGAPQDFRADVVAVAKRDLRQDSCLDGEGGYDVYGMLVPASRSLEARALPIGLASGARLTGAVPKGGIVSWNDVSVDESGAAVKLRKALEAGG
jgi:predicted homoserine dehydrogenase-like protein